MTACPFCNHSFDASAASMCPRCGETIPAAKGQPTAAASIMARDMAEVVELGAHLRRRVKRAVIVCVLICLVLVMIVFVQMALREEPPGPVHWNPTVPIDAVTAPLNLRGLQYLPPNCNVVFALQPGPLVIHAEAKKQNPAEILAKVPLAPTVLATLATAGITLSDIDHVVGGSYIPDKDEELRIALVLVLRQMRDEAKFLAALKAKPTPGGYDVSFDKFTVRMKKRSATDWCFGLAEKDFDGGGLRALRDTLSARVPRGAALWIAASGEKWNEKPLVKLLGKDALGEFAKWNAFAAGLEFGDDPRLSLAVKAADAATADQLRTRFKAQATGEKSRAGGDGDWATIKKPVDPLDFAKELKTILDAR